MTEQEPDALWRNFPKTVIAFEEKFATEADCQAYWIEARWGGEPACSGCQSNRVWTTRAGTTFECAECGHQTSLTAGTLLHKTHKPLKLWFRAVFEISSRKNGISAKELQRIMGFGSYNTAWTWLHKLRAALVRPDRDKLSEHVEIDEAFVGAKRSGKSLVLVATETDGRVRMAQAENNDAETLKRFVDAQIVPDASVTTDGHAGYNTRSLGERPHDAVVQTKAERAEADAVQHAHWAISLLKRWLLGTHGSAVSTKYLQAYLDEYVFRYNRRRTKGVGRIAARTIAQLVAHGPWTMRQIVNETVPYRMFPEKTPELTA